jgi:hypothetical protein
MRQVVDLVQMQNQEHIWLHCYSIHVVILIRHLSEIIYYVEHSIRS